MKAWFLFCLLLTILCFGATGIVWQNRQQWLPDQVPTHWNAAGEADAWVPRERALPSLLVSPCFMVGMMALMLVLPWLSPLHFKIEPFRPTFDYMMSLLVFLFAYIQTILLLGSMEVIQEMGRWMIGGVLLVLSALGRSMGKITRNFWVGIRTPWTLASAPVWRETHRLAAWTFTLGGLMGFALVVCDLPMIGLGLFLAGALFPVGYSLWLYKRLESQGKLGEE
ncbi:MAG: SdpI family protein [Gemmataceae bacterium]